MKASEHQTRNCKPFPKYCLFTPLLLATLASPAFAGSIADRIRSESGMIINGPQEAMISSMPTPRLSGEQTDGNCVNTSLAFESQAAQYIWQNRYGLPLRLWAIAHTGARASTTEGGQCADMVFATELWQSAIGSPVTGRLSERDVAEFARVVDGSNPQYARARQNTGLSQQDRAIDMFLGLAQQGDAKAQFRVAGVYEQQGNLAEAEKWYEQAADQGLGVARDALAALRIKTGANQRREVMEDGSVSYCEMSAAERTEYLNKLKHQSYEQYKALSKKEKKANTDFLQDANLDKARAAGGIRELEERIMKDPSLGTVEERKAILKRSQDLALCKK